MLRAAPARVPSLERHRPRPRDDADELLDARLRGEIGDELQPHLGAIGPGDARLAQIVEEGRIVWRGKSQVYRLAAHQATDAADAGAARRDVEEPSLGDASAPDNVGGEIGCHAAVLALVADDGELAQRTRILQLDPGA